MNIDKVKKKQRERRDVSINIKTTLSYSKWMAKHEVSPTLLFHEALKEIMEKNK